MTAYFAIDANHPLSKPLHIHDAKQSGLDPGIGEWVNLLRRYGVETYESCEGGEGHAYPEPTIAFSGQQIDGFHALAVARTYALPVKEIRRVWNVSDGEPVGPNWEIVFWRKIGDPLRERRVIGDPP